DRGGAAPDLHGGMRAKRLPASAFACPNPAPVTFADIVFALDVADAVIPRPDGYDGWWPTWSGGFGDLLAHPDPTTDRPVAWWPIHRQVRRPAPSRRRPGGRRAPLA